METIPANPFEYWPVGVALVTMVAWFIRLESKVLYLEKDHHEHKRAYSERETQMWAKIDGLQVGITTVLQALAKIEGKLETRIDR